MAQLHRQGNKELLADAFARFCSGLSLLDLRSTPSSRLEHQLAP